jgi:hypothetical protein
MIIHILPQTVCDGDYCTRKDLCDSYWGEVRSILSSSGKIAAPLVSPSTRGKGRFTKWDKIGATGEVYKMGPERRHWHGLQHGHGHDR